MCFGTQKSLNARLRSVGPGRAGPPLGQSILRPSAFLNTFKMPIRPKEFAVVMEKGLTLLKSVSQEKDLNFQVIKSKMLIGNKNIIQNRLSNNYYEIL